ncbi:MAG TPA: serine hydrolase, partial [Thermoanaerobaculia bacterium]|nr:serine hydrolase [Thermoanaerobaculia bacterium]
MPIFAGVLRRSTVLLLLVAVSACTSSRPLPSTVRVVPADDPLARRVARTLDGALCRFGFVALHVESGRRLEVRGDESFEGASAYKLAMLVEAAARVRDGRLDLFERWRLTDEAKAAPYALLNEFEEGLEPSQRDLLRLMISISDNTAANHFYDLFGKDAMNRRMESLGLSGIRVLERIPSRDPKETEDERW